VTEELDAGPIIEQDVVRVSQSTTQRLFARARAVHCEDRVVVDGNTTVALGPAS
jgi:formyltetrahydrofolate hydrolase